MIPKTIHTGHVINNLLSELNHEKQVQLIQSMGELFHQQTSNEINLLKKEIEALKAEIAIIKNSLGNS